VGKIAEVSLNEMTNH